MDPPASTLASNPQHYDNDDGHRPQAATAATAPATATATATASSPREHVPTPNIAASNGRKRRASGVPGSRGVANLTPEQLAKKRANDREAQRAIRERTRNTIESLERRIKELESQQPFQELQRVIQERDRALAECEELRRRLGAVAGIVGGQTGGPGLNELATLTVQQSPLPPVAPAMSGPHSYSRQPGQAFESQYLHPDLRSPQSSTTQPTPPSQAAYQAGEGTLRKWSPSLDHLPNAATQHGPSTNGALSHNLGERLGVNFLLESSHRQQQALNSPRRSSHRSPTANDVPTYRRLTPHGDASCPLDYLLLDFHASRRKTLRDGASKREAIGPEYPAFAAMVEPGAHPQPHPVSALLIDILSKFPDISKLPEKVAVLYIMFLVMRWQICPCQECYERLPEWCRPIPEQFELHHVAWSDYLPWPYMRKMIILNKRPNFKFDDFFVPYCMTLSLNWPLPHDCILLPTTLDAESGRLRMNPAFEHHLLKLENWSLGDDFQKALPELVDSSVRIKHT